MYIVRIRTSVGTVRYGAQSEEDAHEKLLRHVGRLYAAGVRVISAAYKTIEEIDDAWVV